MALHIKWGRASIVCSIAVGGFGFSSQMIAGSDVSPATLPVSLNEHFNAPADPEIRIDVCGDWRFKFNPGGMPQSSDLDENSWTKLSLPHSWNAVDGASINYAQGVGWYRKIIVVPVEMHGKRLYLHFEGSSIETGLYIDGVQIDLNPATPGINLHRGAFGAFDFDVTTALTGPVPAGKSGHMVAVCVNNSSNPDVPPCGWGDYSKEGGLYRPVSLIAVNPVHAALFQMEQHAGTTQPPGMASQISSPAVQFTHSDVVIGTASTDVTVKTALDNSGDAADVDLNTCLVDAAGVVQATTSSRATLSRSRSGFVVSQSLVLKSPHLWDGRIDPYLYTLYVEIRDAGTRQLLDLQTLKVGVRSFQISAKPNAVRLASVKPGVSPPGPFKTAFTLNGHPYRLVGADMHQDSGALNGSGSPVGWARSEKQIRADIDMLVEMGGTAVRTSHYQDNSYFYQYCDQVGILVYTESPINGKVTPGDAYVCNAEDQYSELVHQTMNDPSVFAWGFGNETGSSAPLVTAFKQFNEIAHALDRSRKTGFATYGGSTSSATNADGVSDIKGTHLYDYWYGGTSHPDKTMAAYPSQPLGVTEYGGGASAYQYVDSLKFPVSSHPGGVKTHFHPANQQTRLEEMQYTDISSIPYLWGQFTWQMFDNASSGKNEGDQGGVNDKGLVTRDRVRKDSFYFYKASLNDPNRTWNNQPVVYISDHYWTARTHPAATATVFSNVGVPELVLNGTSLGKMAPLVCMSGTASITAGTNQTIPVTYVMDVKLIDGSNALQAIVLDQRGRKLTDSAEWNYFHELTGTSVAKVEFLAAGQKPGAGFLADYGEPYAARAGQAYGWRITEKSPRPVLSQPATGALGSAMELNYNPIFKTSSKWEFRLPPGLYDVEIGAGGVDRGKTVNMFAIGDQTVAVDSDLQGPQTTFFTRVKISGDHLSLSAAPGAFGPQLKFLLINRMDETNAGHEK